MPLNIYTDREKAEEEAYNREMDALRDEGNALDPEDPDYEEKYNIFQIKVNAFISEHWQETRKGLAEILERLVHSDSPDSTLIGLVRQALDMRQGPPPPPMFKATPKRARSVEYPLDKVNSRIWSLLEEDTSGQLALKAERAGSGTPLNIYYAIDFDALEGDITISRRLTAFDKRAYIAISALFNAGNSVMTMTQIYYAMGYTGKPGRSDLERIDMSVTKMTGARIYVNNEQEAGSYRYDKFVYDGSLLPVERGTAMVGGQYSDSAIHLFREPPVISFAKQRRQLTTLDVKLLQSPVNKTDQNLILDDYLIERIARARNKGRCHRVLFKTLYEKVGANTSKQRQRIPEKVRKYLDHYRQCGMIEGYEMGKDGVTVRFAKE